MNTRPNPQALKLVLLKAQQDQQAQGLRTTTTTPPPPPYSKTASSRPTFPQTAFKFAPGLSMRAPSKMAHQNQIASHVTSSSDSDTDSEPELSPIRLHINAPISISGNNNVLLIDAAKHAKDVLEAVVEGIRKGTMGNAGIPMIDEEGRPRPVDVSVEAGVKVEGEGNVVGDAGDLVKAGVDLGGLVEGKGAKKVGKRKRGESDGEECEGEVEERGAKKCKVEKTSEGGA